MKPNRKSPSCFFLGLFIVTVIKYLVTRLFIFLSDLCFSRQNNAMGHMNAILPVCLQNFCFVRQKVRIPMIVGNEQSLDLQERILLSSTSAWPYSVPCNPCLCGTL